MKHRFMLCATLFFMIHTPSAYAERKHALIPALCALIVPISITINLFYPFLSPCPNDTACDNVIDPIWATRILIIYALPSFACATLYAFANYTSEPERE